MTEPAHSNNPYAQIDAVLRKIAHELPRLPDWAEAVGKLSANSSDDERLAVYQAVRDDGCLQEDEGEYLICFTIDEMMTRSAASDLAPIDERATQLDAACAQGKITTDKPPPDPDSVEGRFAEAWHGLLRADLEGPAEEVNAFEAQALEAWRALLLKQLREHGETRLVRTVWRFPTAFASAMRNGRAGFFNPSPDVAKMRATVQSLFDAACDCIHSDRELGPFRCRWRLDLGFIDVSIYPTPVEFVGGRRDGQLVDPDLSQIDLIGLQEVFDDVYEFYWSVESDERQHQCVCLEGVYGDYDTLTLALYAGAQEGEKPGRRVNVEGKWDPDEDDAGE
jgi:hypothetical protein